MPVLNSLTFTELERLFYISEDPRYFELTRAFDQHPSEESRKVNCSRDELHQIENLFVKLVSELHGLLGCVPTLYEDLDELPGKILDISLLGNLSNPVIRAAWASAEARSKVINLPSAEDIEKTKDNSGG